MRTRAAQAITILLFALVMGVFWGTWFSLSRTMTQLSPDTFLAVEVPIDHRIQSWTAASLPGDWRSVQARWETWHTVRTFLSIAAVAAATISAVTTGRPVGRPGRQPTPDDRAVAGNRPA